MYDHSVVFFINSCWFRSGAVGVVMKFFWPDRCGGIFWEAHIFVATMAELGILQQNHGRTVKFYGESRW
ncbi:hypothetical protein SAMN05660830_01038 [Halodesulfovibrio aestuarii]|uniref:Uncharacterized protein n=1 Tax=Halodesulfovibrio aestuarii TaxID=126333 RepID=A0A8G2C8E0_9BACT|nr:hypothetical protein SAMN05660830_01038 [Halodesulfovibrio aestuarii]